MNRYITDLGIGAKRVVQWSAGMLQKELVADAPPKNRKTLEKRIRKDVKGVFAAFDNRPKQAKHGSYVWLASGPKFIYAVDKPYWKPKESAEGLKTIYEHNTGKMGKRFSDVGYHGKQAIKLINRFVITKRAFNAFAKAQEKLAGKLKASFAVAWSLGVAAPTSGVIPQFVRRHLDGMKAKGSFISNLNGENPSITLISRAPGCEHEGMIRVARRALRKRIASMTTHIRTLVRIKDKGTWKPEDF